VRDTGRRRLFASCPPSSSAVRGPPARQPRRSVSRGRSYASTARR